jgi:hypothetical protein
MQSAEIPSNPFSTYDGNKNRHIGDIVEHTRLFFYKVVYLRYDVA